MLFKSPLVGEASGSVGGLTASHNRYGQYFRARAIPVNPNSSRQVVVKARFAGLAFAWVNNLTQLQRDAWDLYGENVIMKNKLGADIKLTGYSHFQRSNGAVLAAGSLPVFDGPTNFSLAPADSDMVATISEATQLISVAFDDTLDWVDQDDGHMLIHMAMPRSGSRLFIGGPTRVAGSIDGDSTTPPTTPATIAVPFAVAATQKTEVLARVIEEDGRVSGLFRDAVTVAV